MDYTNKKVKDYTINRALQFISLAITFFLSSFYTNRSAVIEVAKIMGGEITESFIIFTMMFSAIFVVGLYYLGLKIIYNIADKIYKNHILKALVNRQDLHNRVKNLPVFPIDYDTYKWEVSWYVVAINIIMALVRVIYFYAPYSFGIIEAIIPVAINVGLMSLYFVRIKNKYLNDNTKGIVFLSLIVPYSIFLIIFV